MAKERKEQTLSQEEEVVAEGTVESAMDADGLVGEDEEPGEVNERMDDRELFELIQWSQNLDFDK